MAGVFYEKWKSPVFLLEFHKKRKKRAIEVFDKVNESSYTYS